MDLLRFDTEAFGALYIDARCKLLIGRHGDNGAKTNICVLLDDAGIDIVVPGDVDEVAACIERAYPNAHIWRVDSAV